MSSRGSATTTKHHKLVAQLLQRCQESVPGTAIPSERELSSQAGVSRMTMRTAIDELVADGYLVRRHGSGTYVARPKISKPMYLTSFSDDMRSRGLVPSTRVVAIRRHPAGARVGSRLQLSPEDTVVTVGRLRLADGEPMAMEWLNVPDALLPNLRESDFDGPFYRLLRDRYDISLDGGQQTVEATVTDEEQSKQLGVPLHSPALAVERITWTSDGTRVELVHSLYRGDRYQFGMDLVRSRVPQEPSQ